MTITVSWWFIPAMLVILALWFIVTAKPTGDWDFITPIISVVIAIALLACAGAFLLGRWLA